MDDHVIDHFIPKRNEGFYYTIKFPVPEKLERITISYSYRRMSGRIGKFSGILNIVDIGLMDGAERFLGWSGSSKKTIFTGPYASTAGYLMTEIIPGEWSIIVGAYKIPEKGLQVRYKIKYTLKKPRWLTGDLHIHSNASDGQHDIHTLAKMAQKARLDFIAVANHNNYSENFNLPSVPNLTFLPAVEWTHYRGHMNFFGVLAPFDNSFIANNEDEMRELVESVKLKGALVSVNHPKCSLCPYLWNDENIFDLVEVWNGPMRKDNLNGIAWWQSILENGKKIPLVGGSDFHKDRHPVKFARPVTRVYAQSPSVKDILKAIADGHSYVTASTRGVLLDLRCGDVMMGGAINWREGTELLISADRLRFFHKLRLHTSEGVAAEWRNVINGCLKVSVPVLAAWRFSYLTAAVCFGKHEYIRAISNPVYFNHSV